MAKSLRATMGRFAIGFHHHQQCQMKFAVEQAAWWFEVSTKTVYKGIDEVRREDPDYVMQVTASEPNPAKYRPRRADLR